MAVRNSWLVEQTRIRRLATMVVAAVVLTAVVLVGQVLSPNLPKAEAACSNVGAWTAWPGGVAGWLKLLCGNQDYMWWCREEQCDRLLG
jgi:hypothetical protein